MDSGPCRYRCRCAAPSRPPTATTGCTTTYSPTPVALISATSTILTWTRTGCPDPGQLQQELEDRLPGAKVRRVCWGFTEAGGYNRAWGLPLPSPRAVAAGSVLLLDTETDVFATAVRNLLD